MKPLAFRLGVVHSPNIQVEHPRKSGNKIWIPENDKGGFFPMEEARKIVFATQQVLLDAMDVFFAGATRGKAAGCEEKENAAKKD